MGDRMYRLHGYHFWAERIFEWFEHPRLQIEVSQIIIHKADQPDVFVNFFDADGLTPKRFSTSALALRDSVRLHGILGCPVVSKFFSPDIVLTDVQGTEQVCHRGDHSRRTRDIEDGSVESG